MKLLTACICLFLFLQPAAAQQLVVNAESIIKDSTGKTYGLTELMDLMKTKQYAVVPVENKPNEFLLKKKSADAETSKSEGYASFTGIGELMQRLGKSKAPSIRATSLDGKTISPESLKGKIVVLAFWFTACKPCIQEMPELNELVGHFKNNPNVVFLAPTFDDKAEAAKFMASHSFSYRILPGQKALIDQYKVQSYPSHVLVDHTGAVRFATEGYMQGDKFLLRVLKYRVEQLLEEKREEASLKRLAATFISSVQKKDFGILKADMNPYFAIRQSNGEMAAGGFVESALTNYFKEQLSLTDVQYRRAESSLGGFKLLFDAKNPSGGRQNFFVETDKAKKITGISFLRDVRFPAQLNVIEESKANMPGEQKGLLASLPFAWKNNQAVIRVRVNGSKDWLELLFDSGASLPMLTKKAAEKLGLTPENSSVKLEGGGGTSTSGISKNNRIYFDDSLWLDQVSFSIHDFSASQMNFPYDGIIGADLMKNFVVEVDFDSKILKLFSSKDYAVPGGWQTVAVKRMIGSVPVIETTLRIGGETTKAELLFDCGSAPIAILLSQKQYKTLQPQLTKRPFHEESLKGIGGPMITRTYLESLSLYDHAWKEFPIAYDINGSTPLLLQADGILGMEYISRHNLIFNYGRNEIYLKPNGSAQVSFPRSYSGIQLTGTDGKTRIKHLSPGSPGALAGLKIDDVLTAVDGMPVTNAELARTLLNKTEPVELMVKRKDRELKFRVNLGKYY
ncbi:MAG TPA: redoxin domain-containing protein [Flavisolibacter sp.]|nr:redoxin domain-containing protein [Flavisolibacter sp.]